jgi:hypothetical protein
LDAKLNADYGYWPSAYNMADVRMARLWYEKARDLGSTEAAVRLERLRSVPGR